MLLPSSSVVDGETRAVLEQAGLRRQLQSDHMAALGTLSAGLAHEINNPLTYVLLNLEHVLRRLRAAGANDESLVGFAGSTRDDERPGLVQALLHAVEGANRIRRVVGDVLTFAQGNVERRGLVDVRGILESATQLAWHEIRHRARLSKILAQVPPVEANEARLAQLFLCLLINAAHAIPEGQADRHEVRVTTKTDARNNVVVEVSDTGRGIAPENLSRVFDPFFTTEPQNGSGLGLAISHGTVKSLGGEIAVTSEPGRGTTFRVVLRPAERWPASTPPGRDGGPPTRRRRVLVIDDDRLIGEAIASALSETHDVEIVTEVCRALDRITAGERYDVVVCELMMPVMTGMDLLRHDRAPRSEARRVLRLYDHRCFQPAGPRVSRERVEPVPSKAPRHGPPPKDGGSRERPIGVRRDIAARIGCGRRSWHTRCKLLACGLQRRSHMRLRVRDARLAGVLDAVAQMFKHLNDVRTFGLAAEMAFWLFLSLIPLAAVAGLVAAKLAVRHWGVVGPVVASLPPDTSQFIATELRTVAAWNGGAVALPGAAIFVWLAASGVHAVFDALEIQTQSTRPWWKKRALAIISCVSLSIGVGALALLATGIEWIEDLVKAVPFGAQTGRPSAIALVARGIGGLFVLYGLNVGLFVIGIPREDRSAVPLAPGAFFSTVLETILSFGYGLYVRAAGTGDVYRGALGVIGVTMITLYLLSVALLFGAELNRYLGGRGSDRPREAVSRQRSRPAVATRRTPLRR